MEKIKIGSISIEKTAALAPMASVGDRAYREMCKSYGAAYLVGEMASAKGLFYSDKKTNQLLYVSEFEQPMAVQLFGDSPDFMARATKVAASYMPQIIDVNMGCPVPKVAGNGAGSALMKTPELAYSIVKAMVNETDIPITVKIRKGWDEENINAVEFAKLMQDAGAAAITIHGRTKQQMYHPPVDLDIIKAVKTALHIPVIGNGGITSAVEAKQMYDYTGCDLVMIGQATYGRPWIFEEIKSYLESGIIPTEKTPEERLSVMLKHIKLIVSYKGERQGMREARKHAAWYIKGLNGAAAFRNRCGALTTLAQLEEMIKEILIPKQK